MTKMTCCHHVHILIYVFIEMMYSPRFAWGGRPHRRLFWPTQTYIQKIRQKHCFFQCFYNVFRQKYRNLRYFRHKVGPKHWFLQCFQGSGIKKVQCRDLPKPLKTQLFTQFSSIFPCAVIYTFFGLKSVQNTGFCSVFNALASKTIQNIAICSVFSFLSVFPMPEADQNDPKFRFNTILSSDTQKSSEKHANTTNTRSRCEIVFAPPPS